MISCLGLQLIKGAGRYRYFSSAQLPKGYYVQRALGGLNPKLASKEGSLKGKTVLISGGSRGIGLAIGIRAARDGANVVIAAKTVTPHPKLEGSYIHVIFFETHMCHQEQFIRPQHSVRRPVAKPWQ